MARRLTTARLLRIVLARSPGGRSLPAIIQLVLIVVWHPLMILLASTIPFDDLQEWSSLLWYRAGITSSYITVVGTFPASVTVLTTVAVLTTIFVLLEAVLGWFGYRILIRRPSPKWYRFVRFWWRTCILGTVVVLAVMTFAPLLPVSPGSPFALLGVAILGVFFCLGPGWLARREVIRRGRRIGKLCPVCRYCLRGIAADVCPECGTPLIRDSRGGYAIDRARLRQITKRQGRRWIGIAKVAALLLVGAAAANLGDTLYERYLKHRFTSSAIILRTPQGDVAYRTCHLCDSVQITLMDGSIEYPIQSETFADCSHRWEASFAAWSAAKLSAGDVLLVRRGGHYNAVRILSARRSSAGIRYEWYHQPNKAKGTFVDDSVECGEKASTGKIAFKDVDIPYDFGSIWYDYYYGGINPASRTTADPHYIAFAGKVDIAEVDAADPGWIYKTWEDGKPNGYEEDSSRIDLRLSDKDTEALKFIWNHLAPTVQPKDDEELARFRHILKTSVVATLPPIWPTIRDDFHAGGRPGASAIWDDLVGYRIAQVSTQGLGRVRGVIVPVFRTVGQDNHLVVQTDEGGVKIVMADIEMLRLGRPLSVQSATNRNDAALSTVSVRVRTTTGKITEGVMDFDGGMLDFWLYPFTSLASTPDDSSAWVHLTLKTDEPSAIQLMRYEWIAFTDTVMRVCPKCGEPAESINWTVCPFDGTSYE